MMNYRPLMTAAFRVRRFLTPKGYGLVAHANEVQNWIDRCESLVTRSRTLESVNDAGRLISDVEAFVLEVAPYLTGVESDAAHARISALRWDLRRVPIARDPQEYMRRSRTQLLHVICDIREALERQYQPALAV